MKKNEFTIVSFYQFKQVFKTQKLKNLLKDFCQFHKLKGTIIIAPEGINGSIGGLYNSVKTFEKKLIEIGFNLAETKFSYYHYMPFYRLKIRIKKEIISFSKKNLNVEQNTGEFIEPLKWNKIIDNDEYYLLDIRNDYESEIGTFNNSKTVNIKNFIDFKDYIKNNLMNMKTKKIAMFCTGGIRCEKASSYMFKLGFKNLYQLKGGILKYLETVPKKQSNWVGECFLFDNRVAVKNEMKGGSYSLCYGCRKPITAKNKLSSKFEEGVSCEYCFDKTNELKKEKLRQRNKQIDIAKKRGLYNPYIRYTPTDYH